MLKKSGFTFLEILVVLVILSFGLVAIMNWVPLVIQNKIKAQRRTQAIFLAQLNIENAKWELYSDFNQTASDISWTAAPGFMYIDPPVVAVLPGDRDDLKTITFSIWHTDNPNEITTFSTKVARR